MAKDDDDLTAKPGEDPYELEWPDDAKEARAQQRENEAALNQQAPVSRGLAALVIGVGVVLAFLLALGVAGGTINFFIAVTAPVVLGGLVVAFPTGWVLDRVVRGMPRGVGEVAFVVLGGAIGYGLTWAGLTLFQEYLFETVADMQTIRNQGAIFMMTAVATAFLAAYMLADKLRRYPKQVAILGGMSGLLFVMSILANIFATGG